MSAKLPRPEAPQLYAIVNGDTDDEVEILANVEATLAAGSKMLQLRCKNTSRQRKEKLAHSMQTSCRRHGATFIVNDDIALAMEVAADGVHVGKDDEACAAIRTNYGDDLIIGVSCYNSLDRARQALHAGASYLAFGSMFASPTKPHAVRCTPELIEQARAEFDIPIVVIGGIEIDNAAIPIRAGADYVAVISGLFASGDVNRATLGYLQAIMRARE